MWWMTGLVCNAVVATAYLLISLSIIRPLVSSGQLRSNPLGAATAAIFLTCAVHHGGHSVHMLLPYAGIEVHQGIAMREAFDWQMAVLGRGHGGRRRLLLDAAAHLLLADARREAVRGPQQREQQALELNDEVLQGIVVAKLALDLDDRDKARESLDPAIGRPAASSPT